MTLPISWMEKNIHLLQYRYWFLNYWFIVWMLILPFSLMGRMTIIKGQNWNLDSAHKISSFGHRSLMLLMYVLHMVESSLTFVAAAANSVYWQWFSKLFLSSNILQRILSDLMPCRLRDQRLQVFSNGIHPCFLPAEIFPGSLNLLMIIWASHWETLISCFYLPPISPFFACKELSFV